MSFRRLRRFANKMQPANDARHVSIQHSSAPAECDGCDRSGRVSPNTWQFEQILRIIRHSSGESVDDNLRRLLKMPGARIVSQPLPEPQNLLRRRARQIGNRRKSPHESQKIWCDRSHLRLLQHDLADQNRVRIRRRIRADRRAPGQIAPRSAIPSQQICGELSRIHRHRPNHKNFAYCKKSIPGHHKVVDWKRVPSIGWPGEKTRVFFMEEP